MADLPAPVPCPKCSSTETEVVHLRVEYKRGNVGDGLHYAGGIQDMRCKGCGAEFLSELPPGDDPLKVSGE
ncbi:MAG TPA: hypothetical protein VMP01_02395 [Pirellulaceae bacterium]|nr:hypothetical protein [Pirellulaceae bacterium]